MAHLKIKEEDDWSGGKKKVGWTLFLFFFLLGLAWCSVEASGSAWMGWGGG